MECESLPSIRLRWLSSLPRSGRRCLLHMEFMLRRSPTEAFRVEVVDEMVAKFRKQEEQCSRLERPDMRVCDLFLGPPFSLARMVN
jgi:hypothetical protein